METGEKIKNLRIEKGLTQKELGELCGMADSAIRRYENGRANPKLQTLQKIAAALNVPVEELYSDSTIELNNLTSKTLEWMQHKENCIKKNQFYEEELLSKYSELNNIGKKEAIKRVSELTEIKKYTEPDT